MNRWRQILEYLICIRTTDSRSKFPIEDRLENRRRDGNTTDLHQVS
jgi:hypothetical protein